EIASRIVTLSGTATQAGTAPVPGGATCINPLTIPAQTLASQFDHDIDFDLNPTENITTAHGTVFVRTRPLPPLPQTLSPAQAARLAEMLEFLHRHLTLATEHIRASDDGQQVTLNFADWQRILGLQMVLARYARAVAEPDALEG